MTKNEELEIDKEEKLFELGYILVPTVEDGDLEKIVGDLTKTLEDNGAKIGDSRPPSMKGLSYPIKKVSTSGSTVFDKGYSGSINFTVSSDAISRIKETLARHASILRFFIIFLPKEALFHKERRVSGSISRPKKAEQAPSAPISEAELDKTIEELVIE